MSLPFLLLLPSVRREGHSDLKTARGRPQRLQREYARTRYFCGRCCLIRSDVFAIPTVAPFRPPRRAFRSEDGARAAAAIAARVRPHPVLLRALLLDPK